MGESSEAAQQTRVIRVKYRKKGRCDWSKTARDENHVEPQNLWIQGIRVGFERRKRVEATEKVKGKRLSCKTHIKTLSSDYTGAAERTTECAPSF